MESSKKEMLIQLVEKLARNGVPTRGTPLHHAIYGELKKSLSTVYKNPSTQTSYATQFIKLAREMSYHNEVELTETAKRLIKKAQQMGLRKPNFKYQISAPSICSLLKELEEHPTVNLSPVVNKERILEYFRSLIQKHKVNECKLLLQDILEIIFLGIRK